MNVYAENCTNCLAKYEIISDEFYRGFFVRKHMDYLSAIQSVRDFVTCVRFAEGGNDNILQKIYGDVKERVMRIVDPINIGRFAANYGNCRCHPHESVVCVGSLLDDAWTEGEDLLKQSIDAYWDSLFQVARE